MRSHLIALAAVLALVGVSCGSAGEPTSTTTPPGSVTSTAPTTTTTTSASTTTGEDTTTTEASTTTIADLFEPEQPLTLAPPPSLDGEEGDGSSGSGCSPGSGPLPDGVWYGYALATDPSTISFDLACLWFGEIAYEVGQAAGVEVNNDVYIANTNTELRAVPVSDEAVVWTIAGDPTEGLTGIPYPEWPLPDATYTPCPGEYCSVWLYVNAGEVTEVVEQYLP
jgi:hypothetical protein